MSHRYLAECLDRSLRDIRADTRPFGGVVVVFGGDSRQIPPVARHGSRAQIVAASTKRSPLWAQMRRRRLTRNVRLEEGGDEFDKYLIQIGNGEESFAAGEDYIDPPIDICADAAQVSGPYEDLGRALFQGREISVVGRRLCYGDEEVGKINDAITDRFPGGGDVRTEERR